MNKTAKLRTPFDRLRSYNITPEIALRKGIIMQAILDACNNGKHSKDRLIRTEAKTWLFGSLEDFKQICFEAELDPKSVVRIAIEEMKARNLPKNKKPLNKTPRKVQKKFLDEDICAIVKKYI